MFLENIYFLIQKRPWVLYNQGGESLFYAILLVYVII